MKKSYTELLVIGTFKAASDSLLVKWALVATDNGDRFLSIAKIDAQGGRPITATLMPISEVPEIHDLLSDIVTAMKVTV